MVLPVVRSVCLVLNLLLLLLPPLVSTLLTCPTESLLGPQALKSSQERPRREPWDELSQAEISYIERILREEFNLDRTESFSDPWGSDIFIAAEVEEPPKAAMLAYLEDPENVDPPPRYGTAIVRYSAGFVTEYRVGPLPFPNFLLSPKDRVEIVQTTVDGDLPSTVLPLTVPQIAKLDDVAGSYFATMDGFMEEAFGTVFHGSPVLCRLAGKTCPPTNLRFFPAEFQPDRENQSITLFSLRTSIELEDPFSSPLSIQVDVDISSGTQYDEWQLRNIVYLGQYYETWEDFKTAYEQGQITIVPAPDFPLRLGNPEWQRLSKTDSNREGNAQPPPSNAEPVYRYRIVNERWLDWMGWSFYLKTRDRTGLALFDIRFLGDRIAYELSLQELFASYTGPNPRFSRQSYYDSFYRLGAAAESRSLTEGVDCPSGATYFAAFCVFEHDTGLPLWRKDGAISSFYSGAKRTELTVRSIYVIGNYDYVVDVRFHLDGVIQVGLSASGQMQQDFYEEGGEIFGTRVQESNLAPLHTHFGAFKVDLDVLGADGNCLEKATIAYANRSELVEEPAWTTSLQKNMYVKRDFVSNEDDAKVVMSLSNPVEWRQVSCSEKNRWGLHRGFRLKNYNSLSISDFPSFPKYSMVFTQRKDSEPYLTSRYDNKAVQDPYVVLEGTSSSLSNGETLSEQDIVAWVSMGFYHLPIAEDVPVVNVYQAHFEIRPNNYYDSNPAMDLEQSVRKRLAGITVDQVPRARCNFPL